MYKQRATQKGIGKEETRWKLNSKYTLPKWNEYMHFESSICFCEHLLQTSDLMYLWILSETLVRHITYRLGMNVHSSLWLILISATHIHDSKCMCSNHLGEHVAIAKSSTTIRIIIILEKLMVKPRGSIKTTLSEWMTEIKWRRQWMEKSDSGEKELRMYNSFLNAQLLPLRIF